MGQRFAAGARENQSDRFVAGTTDAPATCLVLNLQFCQQIASLNTIVDELQPVWCAIGCINFPCDGVFIP
jgi:hypothetical protein